MNMVSTKYLHRSLRHCYYKGIKYTIRIYARIIKFTGEVYVLDDGGEVDLDLGNYERFLDVTLHSQNNITTGKIYQEVINRERRGDYLGKTVQGITF